VLNHSKSIDLLYGIRDFEKFSFIIISDVGMGVVYQGLGG